jgi:hypothetical protein
MERMLAMITLGAGFCTTTRLQRQGLRRGWNDHFTGEELQVKFSGGFC